MRNTNLFPQDRDDEDDKYSHLRFTEEGIMAVYEMQEYLYVMSHIKEIRKEYISYIYKQLVVQRPGLGKDYSSFVRADQIEKTIKDIVNSLIITIEHIFILCDPKEGLPKVVVDAHDFVPGNAKSREVQLVLQYIHGIDVDKESDYLQDLGANSAKKLASRQTVHYAARKGSEYMLNRGNRLGELARHAGGGHRTMMRVNRSVRGKKAQQDALINLLKKSGKYGKSAANYRMAGKALDKMARKSGNPFRAFKPVTFADIFLNSTSFGEGDSIDLYHKKIVKLIIIEELNNYCNKHNNFEKILNEQHFSQG